MQLLTGLRQSRRHTEHLVMPCRSVLSLYDRSITYWLSAVVDYTLGLMFARRWRFTVQCSCDNGAIIAFLSHEFYFLSYLLWGLVHYQYAGCSNGMQLLPTTCRSLSLAWPHPSRTFAVA